MFCKNCGAELSDDSKFCNSCGTAVVVEAEEAAQPAVEAAAAPEAEAPAVEAAPAEPAQPKENPLKPLLAKLTPAWESAKPFLEKNKLVLLGAAGVLLLVIAIALISSLCAGGNGFIAFENAIIATVEDDEVLVLWNNKLIETGIEAGRVSSQSTNLDGTVTAFLTNADELYVVRNKKVSLVDENVLHFTLSADGTGIAYVCGEDDSCSLKLYNVSKKKSVTVIDEYSLWIISYYGYEIAPDGKSLAYYAYDEEESEGTLMLFNGKKSIKITSSDVDLLGLSNNGKYIYVLGENDDGDDILYTYNQKGNKEKIGACSNSNVYFNADHSQLLYLNDGKTFLSVNGKEGTKFSSSKASLVIAPNAQSFSNTYPVEDLFDHVYVAYNNGQYNLWVLEKKSDKSEKLASDVDDWTLSACGEYVYYVNDDGELCVLKVSHGDKASDKAKVLAEDVDNYVPTSDCKKVYFIAEDALYSCNGKTGKGRKTIANDDVSYSLAINGKDVVYFELDGDLYACSNGKKATKVLSDVDDLMAAPNGVLYVASEDTMYVTAGDKKLTKLYEHN